MLHVRDGIRKQVREDLYRAVRIGEDDDVVVTFEDECYAAFARSRLHARGGTSRQRRYRHRLRVDLQPSCLGEREILKIVDEMCEVHRLVVQRGDSLRRRRRESVLHRLQLAADVRQRRAQFVSDVADHPFALLLVAVERGGHGVESVRELGQFRAAGRFHAHSQIT